MKIAEIHFRVWYDTEFGDTPQSIADEILQTVSHAFAVIDDAIDVEVDDDA